ncbi:MAG: hypothetical protein OXK80_03725 [Bdellovibrionales bacterium]|nr:hypothetical protein [Bdellovibrionales bacterium]
MKMSKNFIVLCGISSIALAVISCDKNESNAVSNKTQKGVQAAECIQKYNETGCNICKRVGLTDQWECPTGVSCSNQSPEQAKKNSNQCLQVCVTKTDENGCNSCKLSYTLSLKNWGFPCTEIACSEEDKKNANKCTKDMSVREFNTLTEDGFFDL